jgi:hypothetical protein
MLLEADLTAHNFKIFIAQIMSVDWGPNRSVTLKSLEDGRLFSGVNRLPADHSSVEGTSATMPEEGSHCYAVPINSQAGFQEIAVIGYLMADTVRAQQGIATRPIDVKNLQGWNERKRGSHRAAWPGQSTTTRTEGYTEKQDDGWDRTSADMSRDQMDPITSTWTQVASSQVRYSQGGIEQAGPVSRPGAANVTTQKLPDGRSLSLVYLKPQSSITDRYTNGVSDISAFSEHSHKVQEFALDYAVPVEALHTSLMDTILGVAADPWGRTTLQTQGVFTHDNNTFLADQSWDHPTYTGDKVVGPYLQDGPTPLRKGYILEKSEGTLVGSSIFDPLTYGYVLKPIIFPNTTLGRFGTDVESSYLPAVDSVDHAEARLAASSFSVRFPYEYNTTRWDISKEGALFFEIGSTLPKENIQFAGGYEHPHGAGRSIEGHLVGSMKMVVGKNRDEEDAIDLQALGQTVLRLGADDTSLPNSRRSVSTQMRGQKDAVQTRNLQYWSSPKLIAGDAGSLQTKTGGENVSLRGAFDGGTVLRLGARNPAALRRHLINGYSDAPGKVQWSIGDAARVDSKSPGRPAYPAGDASYQFHDLTQVGKSKYNLLPYFWSGPPVSSMDQHGLSMDIHAVRDILLRIGSNPLSGQSLLMDLAGAIVAAVGKDNLGRSITAALDGGVEATIGPNNQGRAGRLEFDGDLDIFVGGNFALHVTGDTTMESTTHQQIAKIAHITKSTSIIQSATITHVTEAPDITHNDGVYVDAEEGS